jgi:5-methylcytosine-specific restriction endonuclease McrA
LTVKYNKINIFEMADCLILNTDASPVSILPLSAIPWQDAIKYMVLDRVTVIEWHEDWIVRSASWSTPVPAVMMLKEYHKKKPYIRFSKYNVFLRDEFRCQYCGERVEGRAATLDHVLPQSLGGRTTWENCTTACGDCNSKKGNNQKIKPRSKPHKPSYWELVEKRKREAFALGHPSWEMFLG